MNRSCLAAVLFASASLATCAQAQDPANIVTNPGFETGDFTGWTQGGDTSNTGVGAGFANTGFYSAFFGNATAGSLVQDLDTPGGGTYDLSFFLALPVSDRPGGTGPAALTDPTEFQAYFGGTLVYDSTTAGQPGEAFEEISLPNLTAADPVTSLEFDFQTEINTYRLDDVSVTAVPEPATWTLLLGSGGLLAGALHRRRRVS